jgi:hypothetical protein
MKKRLALPLLVLALFGIMAAFASSAQAHPTQTKSCSNCHSSDAAVTIAATFVSSNTAGTTYAIGVNNPYGTNGWGVFSGSTKIGGTAGDGANITVPNGVTYTIFGVSGDNNGTEGFSSTSVSPVAPPPPPPSDTTAPTTSSDAVASYPNSATIHLSATDNTGGSGVAHTYYILDSQLQAEGLTVTTSVIGAHTLEFWSTDVAGNIETPHKTAAFQVTAPQPPSQTGYTVRVRISLGEHGSRAVHAVLAGATGTQYVGTIGRNGVVTFTNVPAGVYTLSVTGRHPRFKSRTITVGAQQSQQRQLQHDD